MLSTVETAQILRVVTGTDPQAGLAAVVALRGLVEVVEALQVDNARRAGWSWSEIATELGLSKQAVHHKHAARSRRSARR